MAFTLHFLRPDDLFLDVGANIGSYTLLASGVRKADGEVELTLGRDTCNQVTQGKAGRTQRVSMRTLDTVAGLTPPTMIKVDVEDYEAQVFRGAQAVLKSPLLEAVITEGQSTADIAPLLRAGFAKYEYDPFQRMLSRAARHRSGNNALFLRDSSFVAARLSAASSFQVLGYTI